MKTVTLTETPEQKLQAITENLLQSIPSAEIRSELELLLATYIQYAPVNRLSLANTAGISSKLIVFFTQLEALVEQNLITETLEQFTD